MNDYNNEYPLVSVISVNYNNPEVTGELVESLRLISYPNIEIIIVDNGSVKGNIDLLKVQFPEIILIKSNKNLGFAGGNNLGILQSKGEFILLLNNDTVVDAGFLEPLVNKCLLDPTIGVVSPKIYFYYTPDILQYTGVSEINKFTTRNIGWGFRVKDEGQFEFDNQTSFAHGAAMLVSKKIIMEVGLMAEIYFLYYEEMDWSKRIRDAGYKIFYVHNSIVYHKESVTTGKNSPLKTYYLNRARIIYMRRHVTGIDFIIAFLYQNLIAIPKNLIVFLLKGKYSHFIAYLHAVMWHAKNMLNQKIQENPLYHND